jgi:hypothetical protein
MKSASPYAWWQVGFDMWMLGVESSSVIGLRSMRLVAGDTREAERMVSEKFAAATELGMQVMTGALGASPRPAARKAIAQYRRKVRANRRRLSK